MKTFLLLTQILLAATLVACGSTDTVDSNDVPLKNPTDEPTKRPSEPPSGSVPAAQDIHQSYSLTATNERTEVQATAQFRVRHSRGDTIRFNSPAQVQFENMPLSKIDGDDVNTVVTLLNHLTIIPIFSLFRTGTFYSDSFPGHTRGTFRFVDNLGNVTTTELAVPGLEPLSVPKSFAFLGNSKPLVVQVVSLEEHESADLHCSLSSKHAPEEGQPTSRASSALIQLQGRNGQCTFSSTDLLTHAGALEPVEFKLEFTVRSRQTDAFGRTKETRANRVHKTTVEAAPSRATP